jgi:hypothetical protein
MQTVTFQHKARVTMVRGAWSMDVLRSAMDRVSPGGFIAVEGPHRLLRLHFLIHEWDRTGMSMGGALVYRKPTRMAV